MQVVSMSAIHADAGVVGYSIPLNRLYPGLNRPRLGYTPGYIMA